MTFKMRPIFFKINALVLFFLTLLLLPVHIFSQGIAISNTVTVANQAAMLDISSVGNNKGILIPRVDFSQRSGNFNPLLQTAQGLMVYQTDVLGSGEGLYYNTSTTLTPNWVKAGSTGWGVEGNNSTTFGTHFLGTTDGNGFDLRTNNAIRMTVLSNGNVGVGATSPAVKLAVGGNGVNLNGTTDLWVENNMFVQGSDWVGTSPFRGRLNLGSKAGWPNVGLYAELNSNNAANDLVLGASSNQVRIGPGGVVQKLVLPANTEFQMQDGAGLDKVLRSDASGNGTWENLSTIMQVYTAAAIRTTINYDWGNPANFTDVGGLTLTFNATQNSYVIIRTTGALESTGAGGWSASITALKLDGTSLQEQGTDLINLAPGYMQQHWEIFQTLSVAPGWHTVKVCSRSYSSSGASYYAGGTTIAGLTNSGNLIVRVIPK